MIRIPRWLPSLTAALALVSGCVTPPDPVVSDKDLGSLAFTAEMPLTATGGAAFKTKILRVTYKDGETFKTDLVAIYGQTAGGDVWDFDGSTHPARDIFVRRSTDEGLTWSPEVNVSMTAMLASSHADHDGLPETVPLPYYGDSGKPTVFSNGKNVGIIWEDAYVPGGHQGKVIYPEFGLVEVPYRAIYIARSKDAGKTWNVQLMTNGSRDAKQSTLRGTGAGWAFTWQEDPEGLQPGQAEGPGDGGSGAKVSHGTDIWYTSQTNADWGAMVPLPAPIRVTDNEDDRVGASRCNLMMVGSSALIAYEETKGTQGTDTGKYIRYQIFTDFLDPRGTDPSGGAGYILSDPLENGRRVRMVMPSGGTAGPETGVKVQFLWKQGLYDQGGPSDIMSRIGYADGSHKGPSDGWFPEQLSPPLAAMPTTREAATMNSLALNLSSAEGLYAITDLDNIEDARAHRGVIRGDTLLTGYIWTPDGSVARWTDLENYNFYVRRSDDGGATWSEPYDVSQIDDKAINVREPRIIAAPNSSDPDDPQDPGVAFLAWGTEVNQYEHLNEGTIDLDIYVTRTADLGLTFLETQELAAGPTAQSESQLRTDPSGTSLWSVWNAADVETGDVLAMFLAGDYTPPAEPEEELSE